MPAPNDLTPEEEAMFAEHGVAPAGQGSEPIAEGQEAAPPEGQEGTPPEGQEAAPAPVEVSRHRDDGTFKSKEEYEAEVAAAQAAQTPQGQQPQMVPHQALHETRAKLADTQRQNQLLITRMNAILTQRQPEQQATQMPDISQDPAGYIMALERRLSEFEQSRQQESQFREIDTALENDEEAFKQAVPDYDNASDYYVQSRAKELLQFYTPQDAQRIMMQEARTIAQQSWQRGTSAAQTVYQLAQARGYNPANTAANPLRNPLQGQPQAAPQAQVPQMPAAPGGPNAANTVAAINAAQAQSRSLSGGGAGARATEELNAQALLAMGDDEFEAYLGLGTKGANARFAAVG